MADDKTKIAQDRRRIDVHQDYELDYWTQYFGSVISVFCNCLNNRLSGAS
jgi:Protein of unknown function (DUF3606)